MDSCYRKEIFLLVFLSLFIWFFPLLASALVFERPLALGANGPDVSTLQQVLLEKGYFNYPSITGYFGPVTKEAVIRFQNAHGIDPVGRVGPITRRKLSELSQPQSSLPIHIAAYDTQGNPIIRMGGKPRSRADMVVPVISSISSGTPGATTVTITWATDEAANSQVDYGTTISYGTTVTDFTFTTSHSVNLTSLTGETGYHFRVRSTDASGNFTVSSDQTFTTASPYSAESQALFARLGTSPSTPRKVAYDTLITTLVNGGVWAKLDAFYIFAAADVATALTNLVSSSYGATKVASATFTADRGIAGGTDTSVAGSVDSGFNPTSASSPKFTQNDASVFAWTADLLGQSRSIIQAGNPAVSFDRLALYPRQSNGTALNLLNAESELSYTKITDGGGLQALDRSVSGSWNFYQRGINRVTQSRTSSGVPNSVVKFIGANYTANVSVAGIGGTLTSGQHLTLYNAIKSYLSTVGAPISTAAETLNPASLTKSVDDYGESVETTILSYGGNLITIAFGHSGSNFVVRSYPDGALLASKTWTNGGIYGSAINVGGTIHIFGTRLDGLTVVHSVLDSSYNPSAVEVIYTVGDAVRLANTSVIHDGSKYVMSVERLGSPITTIFLQSADLSSWSAFGAPYTVPEVGFGQYQGSPKLFWEGSKYYLAHLVHPQGAFYMKMARSTDGSTWTTSSTDNTAVLLYPEFSEGNSASDLTLVQDGSDIEGVWIDGSQDGSGNVRRATYTGITLQQLFESFF